MAYNKNGYNKMAQYIISVYEAYKYEDVPDSQIVKVNFPKHNIFISYRQWMNIKGMKLKKSERVKIEAIK